MKPTDSTLMIGSYILGPLLCLLGLLLQLFFPVTISQSACQWFPWILGLFIVGIPHGALDHQLSQPDRPRNLNIKFIVKYISISVLVLIGWWVSPLISLLCFLGIASFHFGQGDLYWSRIVGDYFNDSDSQDLTTPIQIGLIRTRAVLFVLARGLIPVIFPLFVSVGEFARSADILLERLFQGDSAWRITNEVRLIGLGMIGLVVAAHLFVTSLVVIWGSTAGRRQALVEIIETGLLVVFFGLTPPIFAMGIYFNAWHSVRHISRLLPVSLATREAVQQGRFLMAIARFLGAALPMTLGALLMTCLLALLLRSRIEQLTDFGLVALAMIAALTVPHVLVVLWLDRVQGVWRLRSEVSP